VGSFVSQFRIVMLLVAAWIAADGNLTADHSRDTACHRDWYLSRNAFGASRHTCFTYLSANRVWHFASAGLLNHSAAGVWNLLCDA